MLGASGVFLYCFGLWVVGMCCSVGDVCLGVGWGRWMCGCVWGWGVVGGGGVTLNSWPSPRFDVYTSSPISNAVRILHAVILLYSIMMALCRSGSVSPGPGYPLCEHPTS